MPVTNQIPTLGYGPAYSQTEGYQTPYNQIPTLGYHVDWPFAQVLVGNLLESEGRIQQGILESEGRIQQGVFDV